MWFLYIIFNNVNNQNLNKSNNKGKVGGEHDW